MKHIITRGRTTAIIVALLCFCVSASFTQNCNFTITVPDDITLCNEGFVNLNGQIAGDYLNFHWSGSDGYYNDQNLNPNVWVTETTTFTLAAGYNSTTNLIDNGDFEDGATGFTTQYTLTYPGYTCPNGNQVWGLLGCEGTYFVGPSSSAMHTNFANCMPHGGNNMMMLNGASSLQELWCQTISVMPNTDYVFQAFATSIESSSPAILQFAIDGTLLGSPFALSATTCNWQEFYEVWNSGANTSIEICITNQNTAGGGNDFALDDIFFGPICKDSMDFTVFVSDMELEPPADGLIDCTNPTTLLEVTATPANNNYIYEWHTVNGQIESDPFQAAIEVSEAGLYNVTVTDELGCTLSQFAYVDAYLDLPELQITGDDELSCAEPNGVLEADASEPIDEFVWTLPDGSTTTGVQITTELPGWHYVQASNEHGCVGIDSFYVEYLNTQFVYNAGSSGMLTCSDTTVVLTIESNSAYDSISWTGPGIQSVSPDGKNVSVNVAGTYHFTFHYGATCSYTDLINVLSVAPNFQYNLNPADTLTCAVNQVALPYTTLPGTTLQWYYNGNALTSANAQQAGLYRAQIKDLNGCQKTDSLLVAANYTKPSATVSTDTIDCITNFGGFTLDSTNAVSWQWTGPGGSSSNQTSCQFSASGLYTLMITGKNGCEETLQYNLPSDIDFPSLTLTADTITCAKPQGHIHISSSIPVSVTWLSDLGQAGSGQDIIANEAAVYTITATSDKGCVSTAEMGITIDTLHPTLQLSVNDTLDCRTANLYPIVVANNYANFKWTGLSSTSLTPAITKAGTYQLTLEGANGCKNTASISVTADHQKPAVGVSYADLSCAKTSSPLLINGKPQYTYQLTYGTAQETVTTGFMLQNAGTYQLKATANNGCDTTLQFTVTGHFSKPNNQIENVDLKCSLPTKLLRNKATNTYTDTIQYRWWYNNRISYGDTLRVFEAGKAILWATNQWGCEQSDTSVISENFVAPAITFGQQHTILCTADSVWIGIEPASATFQYQWYNQWGQAVASSSSWVARAAGTYTVKVVNTTNGCDALQSIAVLQQGTPEKIEIDLQQALCFGEESFVSMNNIVGGQPPYQLQLNQKGIAVDKRTVVTPGDHQVRITDVNGCVLDTSFQVQENFPFSVDAGQDTVIQLFGQYELQPGYVLNGNEIKDIFWHDNSSLSCTHCLHPIATPEGQTTYVIELVNQNGCVETDEVTLRVKFDKGVTSPNILKIDGGTNQRFTLYNRYGSIRTIQKLSIFDRWGNLVFQRQNFEDSQPDLGWDGTFNSTPVVPGVFVWAATIQYKDGSEEALTGDVTVVR